MKKEKQKKKEIICDTCGGVSDVETKIIFRDSKCGDFVYNLCWDCATASLQILSNFPRGKAKEKLIMKFIENGKKYDKEQKRLAKSK